MISKRHFQISNWVTNQSNFITSTKTILLDIQLYKLLLNAYPFIYLKSGIKRAPCVFFIFYITGISFPECCMSVTKWNSSKTGMSPISSDSAAATIMATSWGFIADSSTAVHGRHIHSTGALVTIFLKRGVALGQKIPMLASRSPISWQHMQERSTCQNLEPDTWK